MSSKEQLKQQAAQAAMAYVPEDSVIGVGTGSTVKYFIEALAEIKHKIEGAVSSSEQSTKLLREYGIPVLELNAVSQLPVYIDGADEANEHLQLIKGGGGALTREKIIAAVADKFICIVDASKRVDVLGDFPLAVEVLPMARSYVARQLVRDFGNPEYRDGFVTDNGNVILDVYNMDLTNPLEVEAALNNITGVVCHGLFAQRRADVLLVAAESGVESTTL